MPSTSPLCAIAVHGGAGAIARATITPDAEQEYHQTLEAALRGGHALLKQGSSSADAVVAAVTVLEDSPLFNAGRGSVLDFDGRVRTDASVMLGFDLTAGAVTNVSGVKNPVQLARAVLTSPHVLLSGGGAEEFARTHQLVFEAEDYFLTEARRAEWLAARGERPVPANAPPAPGTVGAVALDQWGNLAAATSTGGMSMKRWGRIGDSPVVGAGTYADNRSAAVSATGYGEIFLRAVAAHDVCARVRYLGRDLATATREVLDEVSRLGGTGGLIALDRAGNLVLDFNSDGMYRGSIDVNGALRTAIWT